ncbi:Na+/H+ antiporter subunit C [Microbulbifer agarilyticus]|uniref:Na+/H+ antiporter subunit C n=1 Tax=Microbulbifer agarilyticus TaxID=260552 RepID=UPI001C98D823|nr:Na+/H+ antiporter subunit C [Microbulbifer agarilyticus]MBY6190130.1 Na+/H+ antiporter subunit C [Microbulbifer agarilyticus]MCA0892622.1 Na+/H+ antiporter subunit C [Microbulbifer agarilyticus]
MESALVLVIGVMVAAGVYLMLAANLLCYLFGLILLSNAANLVIFVAGRLTRAVPPLIPKGQEAPLEPVANALPQAMILTAIVIGFGLLAFTLALVVACYRELGTIDSDHMRLAEPPPKSGEH